MIKEITRNTAKSKYPVFPNIRLSSNTTDGIPGKPSTRFSRVTIQTYIEANGYYVLFNKNYESPDYMNYVNLQMYIDSLQVEVNKIKKNFKPNKFKDVFGVSNQGLLKIIE